MGSSPRTANKGISGTLINKKDNTSPQAPGYSSPGFIFSCKSVSSESHADTNFPSNDR